MNLKLLMKFLVFVFVNINSNLGYRNITDFDDGSIDAQSSQKTLGFNDLKHLFSNFSEVKKNYSENEILPAI